jgi:hypothetical protein
MRLWEAAPPAQLRRRGGLDAAPKPRGRAPACSASLRRRETARVAYSALFRCRGGPALAPPLGGRAPGLLRVPPPPGWPGSRQVGSPVHRQPPPPGGRAQRVPAVTWCRGRTRPCEASPHKRELKCDTNISPRRLMPHLLHQMVRYRTNLRGGHSIQIIIISNQATT